MTRRSPERSDNNAERKLNDFVRFIELEGNEKVEEIYRKTEEECALLKGRTVQNGRLEINKQFDKKEKSFVISEKIMLSRLRHKFHCQEVENKFRHFQEIQNIVRSRIERDIKSVAFYEKLLKLLILEGLYMLLENNVQLYCRKNDVKLVKSVISEVTEVYETETNRNVTVQVDENIFLPDYILGGVKLTTFRGKIIIENTLDLRIERIMNQCRALINKSLFKKY